MTMKTTNANITLLLRILDDAYSGKGWHGPTLRASVRKVDARQAVWRPAKERHNIAEIVLHTAYWKYAVRRRLLGEKRGAFPLKGSNWFKLPASMAENEWKDYVRLLDDQHRLLRDAVAALPPPRLDETPPGSKIDNAKIIYGIAAHDVYHAGQIRLLKALRASGQE